MKKIKFTVLVGIMLFTFAGCTPNQNPPVQTSTSLTESEARNIAEKNCIQSGETLSPGYRNENSKTWWFDANLTEKKQGCNPACVVSEETKTAQINWRCTGVIPPKDSDSQKSTFQLNQKGGYSGVLTIKGYAQTQNVKEAFCEETTSACKQYSYVFFNIVNTNTNAIFDFLKANEGNSYVGNNKIGLGCVENKVIQYWNFSDELGRNKEFTLSTELSKNILESTEKNPITIKIERLPISGGGDAPTCYSHFTRMSLAQ